MRLQAIRSVLCLALFFVPAHHAVVAQEESEEPPKLLGRCTVEQLGQEPFVEWFRSGYDEYEPNPAVLRALRSVDRQGAVVTVFFGTWCGDSRREVPRMLKVFDEMGLPRDAVDLVAVDSGDDMHKRSPGGEERGLEIYRVPSLVVRRGATEVARLVEFPVLSLERDLLAMLSGAPYEPNYRSYPVIRRWLAEGLLHDGNVSARGLANEVRPLVATEGELAAAATILLERGDTREAIKLAEVNCALHRESASCFARLAEARLRAGDADAAREAAQNALRLNTSPDHVEKLVDLLERTGPHAAAGGRSPEHVQPLLPSGAAR